MANDTSDRDGLKDSARSIPAPTPTPVAAADGAESTTPVGSADPSDSGVPVGASDPNDEIPVPIAMWPSEIDERAQVVEALRGNAPPPRTDTQVDPKANGE
jgi:hypothetical protein